MTQCWAAIFKSIVVKLLSLFMYHIWYGQFVILDYLKGSQEHTIIHEIMNTWSRLKGLGLGLWPLDSLHPCMASHVQISQNMAQPWLIPKCLNQEYELAWYVIKVTVRWGLLNCDLFAMGWEVLKGWYNHGGRGSLNYGTLKWGVTDLC